MYASELDMNLLLSTSATPAGQAQSIDPPAPFGMTSRKPRDVPPFSPPLLSTGREVFAFYCADCHGLDARGVAERGVDLTGSEFLRRLSDGELREYLRKGRAADDPRNKTGRVMIGMEMFPTFADQDYDRVISYLRDLG
jgi:hypothetical protein